MDLETYALLKKKINNISANNISYDNSQSAGLISTNVNDALDELSTKLGIKMVTVSELPLVGDPDILYIVPKSTPEQGNYSDEYTWNATRQDYDKIGDTLINPLPDVTSSDNGKVLGVVNGEWDKYAVPKELPTVSSSDNGKVLSVVSGSWNKKSLTKSDVGLGNVDNTSDVNKPISTATQSALDTKLSEDDLYNMTEDSTVSGNPVTLKTLAKTSAKSCEVTFSPIQSGSGEPSPTNIRPISGRDSLVLNRRGNNLFDEEHATIYNGTLSNEASWIGIPDANSRSYAFDASEMLNTPVTISFDNNIEIKRICTVDSLPSNPMGSYIIIGNQYVNGISNPYTFTPTHRYIVLQFSNTYINNRSTKLQIELGSSATPYKAYQGETHTATFQDSIYGGVWKATEGKAISSYNLIDLGTLTWTKENNHWYSNVISSAKPPALNSDPANIVCSSYKNMAYTSVITEQNNCTICLNNSKRLYLYDSNLASESTIDLSGVKLAFELATPTEITLTPETIELLKGNNTLWTDGDSVKIVYEKLDLTELPDVTSADEGKVLTVNSSGEWVAQTLPDGTNISY